MPVAEVNDVRLFSLLFSFPRSVIAKNKNCPSLELQQYDDFWQHCVDLSASAEGEIRTDETAGFRGGRPSFPALLYH
jgi:hypothetical protein